MVQQVSPWPTYPALQDLEGEQQRIEESAAGQSRRWSLPDTTSMARFFPSAIRVYMRRL